MKIILPIVFMLVFSSCTYDQVNNASVRVNEACKRVVPLAKVASLLPTPPAAEIASYILMACDTSAGLAKLLADPNSEVWLNDLHDKLHEIIYHKQVA